MEYRTLFLDGGICYRLMKKNGEIIKINDDLHDLALAQGAEEIEDDYIEIDDKTGDRLGL